MMNLSSKMRSRVSKILLSCFSVSEIQRALKAKFDKEATFPFNFHKLDYFFHSYNNFRLTERAVEIPIVRHYLKQEIGQNLLEIGNVTNHYYEYFREVFVDKKRTVVDKYETAAGVTNLDICEYAPGIQFDFIFSISTFEHMDSDRGRNPSYIAGSSTLLSTAADNIKYVYEVLLKEGGQFIITAPLGYASEWDKTFYSDFYEQCNFTSYSTYVLQKKTEIVWKQVDVEDGLQATLHSPQHGVNYLAVIVIRK